MGHASLIVSMISARQTERARAVAAAVMFPGTVISRHRSGCYGNRKVQRAGSAAPGCDEEFAVAVAARNGRRDHSGDRPPAGRDKAGDVVADGGMNARIAHDASLHPASAGFEFRLSLRD